MLWGQSGWDMVGWLLLLQLLGCPVGNTGWERGTGWERSTSCIPMSSNLLPPLWPRRMVMSGECGDHVRGVWESVMRLFPVKMPSSLQLILRLPLWDISSLRYMLQFALRRW